MTTTNEPNESVEVSEAQIASHWREEEVIEPSPGFIAQANMADPSVLARFSMDNFPEYFREYADLLSWDKYWHTTLDTSNPPFWEWFAGGRLNASYNCVDRHLAEARNKAAFIWVAEPEDEADRVITYQDLYVPGVNEFAALLQDFCCLKAGDRVTFHMPMAPELPVAMLACARLGVVHSQVFGGFSGSACGDRIVDSGSRVLVTMDSYYRKRCPARSQGKGRRGRRAGREERRRGGQGAGVAAVPRQVLVAHSDGGRPRLLRQRGAGGLPGKKGRAGLDAFRSAPFPDVHERHHRQAQGLPATAPAATCPTSPGRPSTTRTSTRRTYTGASPTSAGSPGTRTSSTAPLRSRRRASCTRAFRRTRTREGRGGSPSGSP